MAFKLSVFAVFITVASAGYLGHVGHLGLNYVVPTLVGSNEVPSSIQRHAANLHAHAAQPRLPFSPCSHAHGAPVAYSAPIAHAAAITAKPCSKYGSGYVKSTKDTKKSDNTKLVIANTADPHYALNALVQKGAATTAIVKTVAPTLVAKVVVPEGQTYAPFPVPRVYGAAPIAYSHGASIAHLYSAPVAHSGYRYAIQGYGAPISLNRFVQNTGVHVPVLPHNVW